MYLLYFTIFVTLCLTEPILDLHNECMDILLKKPFWNNLVSEFPNVAIKDGTKEITLRELFGPSLKNKIVDEINVNEKMPQFYKLLSIFYCDFLYNFLEFLKIYKEKHSKLKLKWNCENDLVLLIEYYDNIYSMIFNSLVLIKSWYSDDASNISINTEEPLNIFKRKLIEINKTKRITYEDLINLMEILEQFLINNSNVMTSIKIKANDSSSAESFIILVLSSNLNLENRSLYLKKYLKVINEEFLKFFNDIGFAFDNNTRGVSLIQ
ncbi:uncharacterized protein LOC126905985 [Daktulosphaira vitifoliae]|uniref:uncharacterized protein LOC126905985 n=1 Tax=Daktulosphaira vitifoliae TaxID=58002 RepID=UPI0021AAE928|nr:uncharacterized protein LOC126905985 [Daktulosphaira vitifoliae]XP_050542162.1 uncharacterized protein LOC126905985 [Daktulosphaira vitifoliae]